MTVGAAAAETARSKMGSVVLRSPYPLTEPNTESRERLFKSMERVRDLGEVFTPAATVQAMLDQLPDETWEPHPSPTFLEPSCGDGNFLVAILGRKLDRIVDRQADGTLVGGTDTAALTFHGLEALASIYAVDISVHNIVGGNPGHVSSARERMMTLFATWVAEVVGRDLDEREELTQAAWWVIEHNLQIGNMLPMNPNGAPSGRDKLPLIEYRWKPERHEVALARTTLGDVAAAASEEMTLFGPKEPALIWEGPMLGLADANSPVTSHKTKVPVRNGRRSSR